MLKLFAIALLLTSASASAAHAGIESRSEQGVTVYYGVPEQVERAVVSDDLTYEVVIDRSYRGVTFGKHRLKIDGVYVLRDLIRPHRR